MSDGFDFDEVFDDDYLYFYEPLLTDQRSDTEAELIWRLAPVTVGEQVLDLACGHGRIANRLAARGAQVTGYDLTPAFLNRARSDASALGVAVEYVQGDVRELGYSERFDVVVNWFTAFGYFDDATNKDLLRRVRSSLRPGGRLLIELSHAPGLWAGFLPSVVNRRGDDMMIDEHHYDAMSARLHNRRTVVRDGQTRSFQFVTRLFAYPELRDWLLEAGFAAVEGFGPDGAALGQHSRRMIVRALR